MSKLAITISLSLAAKSPKKISQLVDRMLDLALHLEHVTIANFSKKNARPSLNTWFRPSGFSISN